MATYRIGVPSPAPPDPAADAPADPPGFVVVVEPGDRIHFLDWGGSGSPGVVLVHGLSASAWAWAPVARRLIAARRTVAMDLRGHGLSDAPTSTGAYDLEVLGSDVAAVAEGSGALDPDDPDARVVIVGHGFGAIAAVAAAKEVGDRCARLVLVDGGLEHLPSATGMDVDEFLRGLDEPPEVMRSMAACWPTAAPGTPQRGTPIRSGQLGPRSSRRRPAGSCRRPGRTRSRRRSGRCSGTART